jgi:hypothetical protein
MLSKLNVKDITDNEHKYCIYTIDPKADWIKVGYGLINRPGSSDYFTSYGHNGVCRMWISNLTKTECFNIEQDIHKYLSHRLKLGNAGKECYLSTKIIVDGLIKEYINSSKKLLLDFSIERESTVVDIRKMSNNKEESNIDNLDLLSYSFINDLEIICDLCNRKSTVLSYKCEVFDKKEDVKRTIYTGPTCFKKLDNKPRGKIFQNEFGKFLFGDSNNEDDNDLVIDNFITQYISDTRIECFPTNMIINLGDLFFKYVKPFILRCVCHYMFIKKKSFQVILTKNVLEEYNLDIDILEVYYFISFSKYFEINDFNEELNQFEIKFIHCVINERTMNNFFEKLESKSIEYKTELDYSDDKLVEEQIECLNSHIPYISGVPGSGKSLICKYILASTDKKVLVICPTYCSLQLLMSHKYKKQVVKENKDIKGIVIDAWNDKRKDMDQTYDILIVDEFYMLNIWQLYKIKLIIDKYKSTYIKIFGDIFQLPCVTFQKETINILNTLHLTSINLRENFREKDYPDEVGFLNRNKTNFKNIENMSRIFEYDKYSKKVVEDRSIIEKHIFLTSTNKTVNEVNKLCYQAYKKRECGSCKNTIKIDCYKFCSMCVKGVKWRINTNTKYSHIEKEDKNYTKIELPLLPDEEKYSNNVMRHNKTGELKYTSDLDTYMVYNGSIINISCNTKGVYDLLLDDRSKKIYIDDITHINLSLCFAMTTHKSQGSTYDVVTFIIDRDMIDSNLLFTALTRATNMIKILILNKLDMENITFNNISEQNSSLDKKCEEIYNSVNKTEHCGKSYIEIYTNYMKEDNKNKKWLNWIMKSGPKKHRERFRNCQLYNIER